MSGSMRTSRGVSFSRMRVLGSYALVYLTSGSGSYQLTGQKPREIKAGDLLVVFPDVAHGYGPGPGEHWNEIYLVFEGAVFDLWRRCGFISPENPILRIAPIGHTKNQLLKIVAAGRNRGQSSALRQACLLQTFLADAITKNRSGAGADQHSVWPAWVSAAIQRMENEPATPLEAIAATAGHSYESFRKKFRAVTGESPAAFLVKIAMNLARKWMYEHRWNNKQIADRLGLCDEFHFSRRFRQITGQTTSEFRHSLADQGNNT